MATKVFCPWNWQYSLENSIFTFMKQLSISWDGSLQTFDGIIKARTSSVTILSKECNWQLKPERNTWNLDGLGLSISIRSETFSKVTKMIIDSKVAVLSVIMKAPFSDHFQNRKSEVNRFHLLQKKFVKLVTPSMLSNRSKLQVSIFNTSPISTKCDITVRTSKLLRHIIPPEKICPKLFTALIRVSFQLNTHFTRLLGKRC